jgi:hypothetical protein
MQSRGIVFYSISRDSTTAPATKGRFAFDGPATTVETLVDDIMTRMRLDPQRMHIDVRPDPAQGKPGAATPTSFSKSSSLKSYSSVEVSISRITAEHEAKKKESHLDALEQSLFARTAPSPAQARPAGDAKVASAKPSVMQLAMLEVLDLPLSKSTVDVEAAAKLPTCILCDERRGNDNVPAPQCACGPAACGGCYAHCFEMTKPLCPVCGVPVARQGHRPEG